MNIELNPTNTAAAAKSSGDVPSQSGRKASDAADVIGSVSMMDTEGKYDRLLAGSTPRAAAEMIRKRLNGACTDPVRYEEDATGFDFYIGGIPSARLQVYSKDNSSEWHVDAYNVGKPFTGTAANFLNTWYPGRYRRSLYAFAFPKPREQKKVDQKRKYVEFGNSLKCAPNRHARLHEDLNDGAQIRTMLQRVFGGKAKRHVVQARFMYKFGNEKKGIPDRVISTFWVEDKKLFEYRRDVEVKDADGNPRKHTTLTQRLAANDRENEGNGMPRMAALARFHAKNGRAFFSEGALMRSDALCNDLYEVFPQYAPKSGNEAVAPTPVSDEAAQFSRQRAVYALHAVYSDFLAADDQPKKRTRKAPSSWAIAKTSREEKARMQALVNAQKNEARTRATTTVSYEEFLKALPSDPMAELEKLEAFQEFEGVFEALKHDRDEELLYTAAYAVFKGYHVSMPEYPAANIGALVSRTLKPADDADRFLSEAAPSSWGSAPGEYETTLDMPEEARNTAGLISLDDKVAECVRVQAARECSAYESMVKNWDDANKDYPELAAYIGDVRDALLDADDLVAGGAGSTKTIRIGGARFVRADSALGQLAARHERMVETARLAREATNATEKRSIDTAKQTKRDQQKKAVEAGKRDLANAEADASGKRHRVRDSRGRFAKKGSAEDASAEDDETGKKAKVSAKSQIKKVPVEIDPWCRALGPNFSRANFIAACRNREAYTLKSLEKAAYKHVSHFESRGWEWKKNPKITAMIRVIEEAEGVTPDKYKPAKSARSGRPRGQKRQHNNNGSSGSADGQKPKRDGYSRKHAPQTGTTSGLGNSP